MRLLAGCRERASIGVMMAPASGRPMEELSSKADAEFINSQKLGSGLQAQQGVKVPLEAPSLPETCRCVIEYVSRPLKRLDWRR